MPHLAHQSAGDFFAAGGWRNIKRDWCGLFGLVWTGEEERGGYQKKWGSAAKASAGVSKKWGDTARRGAGAVAK